MLSEEKLSELLSKNENLVYEYIKETTGGVGGKLEMSMKKIGEKIGVSEASVHRAIRKLRKQGVVGIIPSTGKFETNEIVYYGIPDPAQQIDELFNLIGDLSSSANRFEAVLKSKEQENEQLLHEREMLYERIDELERELREALSLAKFDTSRIISSQPLGDGTTAYIIKD